jgi:peptide-methionine (R)-S-oxide reductase
MKQFILAVCLSIFLVNLGGTAEMVKIYNADKNTLEEVEKIQKPAADWKKLLTPQQFNVTQEHGTERAYTGEYWNSKKHGIYKCIRCGTDLFTSETKYDSKTGWPSFWQPIAPENVGTEDDFDLGSRRVVVHCARCGAHLGHVFDDGPLPTGKRFCMNSVSLKFVEKVDSK